MAGILVAFAVGPMLKLSGFTKLVIVGVSAARLTNALLAARLRVLVEPRSHRFLDETRSLHVCETIEVQGINGRWVTARARFSADAPGTIMSQKFAMATGLMDKHSRPRVNALQQFMLYGSLLVFVQIKWRLYDVAVSSGAGIYVSRMYDLVHDPYSILFSNSATMMFDGVDIILGPDQVAVLRSQCYTVDGLAVSE